ncbi:MAG: hypothetical protein ACLP5V_07910 [Candidatus Bathyarchaeia archaeon]
MPRAPIVKRRIAAELPTEFGLTFTELVERVNANRGNVSRALRDLMKEETVVCQVEMREGKPQKVYLYNATERDNFNKPDYKILRCFLPLSSEAQSSTGVTFLTKKEKEMKASKKESNKAFFTAMSVTEIAKELRQRYSLSLPRTELDRKVSGLVEVGCLRPLRPGKHVRPQTDTSLRPHAKGWGRERPETVFVPRRIRKGLYQLTATGLETALLSSVKVREKINWQLAAHLYQKIFWCFQYWEAFVSHGIEEEIIKRIIAFLDKQANFLTYEPERVNFKIDPFIWRRQILFPITDGKIAVNPQGREIHLDRPWPLRKWVVVLKNERGLRADAQRVVWSRYAMYKDVAASWQKVWRQLS